jgi:hypothetical protein
LLFWTNEMLPYPALHVVTVSSARVDSLTASLRSFRRKRMLPEPDHPEKPNTISAPNPFLDPRQV